MSGTSHEFTTNERQSTFFKADTAPSAPLARWCTTICASVKHQILNMVLALQKSCLCCRKLQPGAPKRKHWRTPTAACNPVATSVPTNYKTLFENPR